MSWRNHDLENPLESQSYRDCMMALAYSILGQPDEKLLETILKAPYILRWPIESTGGGGYEPDSKRPRTTYILDSCAGLGGSTARCGGSKTHIEHPWHFEGTKHFLLDAFTLACSAMEEKRLNRVQCAEALVEIMDARRHSVLMPGCAQPLFGHDLAKDGFAARYQGCVVLRRDDKTQVDFAVEDQLTAKRVDDAINFLKVGTSSRAWVWDVVQPINKLSVTNKDVTYVINQLTLAPRNSPKSLQNGWSLYGKSGIVFSGLKADMHCRLIGPESEAIGAVKIPRGGDRRLTSLPLDEFKILVQQHYGVVY